jgi:hypothetical protein
MTRAENTGTRELTFSNWIRNNLPDSSSGFLVSDLDFILYNYKSKKIMLVEVKTRNARMRTWQGILFCQLSQWIQKGISEGWTYHGFHLIRFENTYFNDGLCFLDEKKITEKDLISFMSLGER